MSPDKLVDENDPYTWVAKTKVASVKFTKCFLFIEEIHMNNTVAIICSTIQNLKQYWTLAVITKEGDSFFSSPSPPYGFP